jgi:riboflavin kinase/FMN adenylyltransferase
MLIFTGSEKKLKKTKGYSVAIGNFDGLHSGHLEVISLASKYGQNLETGVLTFEPHPRQFFNKNGASFRLMNAETRLSAFKKIKLDVLFQIPFNRDLASLSPESFIENTLIKDLNIRHVVVGENFRFGKNRSGSIELLKEYHQDKKIRLTIAPPVKINGEIVSSSLLREKLKSGLIKEVTKLLNRHFQILGVVEKGFQRGRKLGFPTINVELNDIITPKHGVYAAIIEVITGKSKGKYHGAASIGSRPTYGNYTPNIEVFLFNFNKSLYGDQVLISLVDFIRPEIKFASESELIFQMKEDCDQVLKVLKSNG